jgi:hypothetical protein
MRALLHFAGEGLAFLSFCAGMCGAVAIFF